MQLGHAPRLHERPADRLTIGLRERLRHCRSSAHDVAQQADVAALELVENAQPDGGDSRGERHALDQLGERARREIAAGQHQGRVARETRVHETPGKRMEHRHDRHDDVALRDAERIGQYHSERVEAR